MDHTETTECNKSSGGECSQAEHSTKEATNSCTEKSFQTNESTRSDHIDKDIFLSHSGKQKMFVRQLYTDLTDQGLSCFFDQDPESLPPGEDFPSRIFVAAKTCEVAILLLSKDFLKSKWPMQELAAFVKARKTTPENPKPKILPLFFHIPPDALKEEKVNKEKWKQLKISKEEEDQWLEALKAIRPINGMLFRDGDDEVEFRKKIVKEIWRIVSPLQRYHIPTMQGGERMCQEVANFFTNVLPNENGVRIAGLYGIAGNGKTLVGKAFCNFKLGDFQGKVCHLEFSRGDPLQRVKLALQYLTLCSPGILETLKDLDRAKYALYNRVKGKRILLVLDNVTEENKDEVRYYINAGLGENSYILISARSVDLLVNDCRIDSPSCMHVPILKDDDAISILLERTYLEVSTLGPEDKAFALKCASRCSFSVDPDRKGRTYHPLALKAFGCHLFSKHNFNLSKRIAEVDGLVDRSGYGLDDVFAVLGKAFNDMSKEQRTIFMLLSICMPPNMSPGKVTVWLAIICNKEIAFIEKAVGELCKKAFVEEFEPEIHIHDLYIEFAKSTANEMRKWLWWKGDESSTRGLISEDPDGFELAKLEQCKYRDPSDIPPEHLENLLQLQLVDVQNMSELDLTPMRRLRSLTLQNCRNLVSCRGMEKKVTLAWLQISMENCKFELPRISSLKGLQHLEINIADTQALGDLTPCKLLREIFVSCKSLPEFPRLNGLPYLEKVEFSMCNEVKGPLDFTDCELLQSIVLNGCCKMATPPVLAGCKKVEKIVLSDCDAVTECPNVDEPSALKSLELSISSKAASAPRCLESCDRLDNLHLWNMGELKELPSFIRLSNLTMLKIGKCGIREPPDLTCCLNLENVCFFTLKNLERFPNFSKLTKLKILSLYDCRRVQYPPDICGCHELQVFHLVDNDNIEGLPKMHECPILDEIKVSWHCKDEITYEGINPDTCEADDNFQSCLDLFNDEILVENLEDVCFPTELRDWLEKCWMNERPLVLKRYFRGAKLFCSAMASYKVYGSTNCYSQSPITLSLVDSKLFAFPTPGSASKDRQWLNKVRKYFGGNMDIARATAASECENVEALSLPLPRYHFPPMQGEARMCKEVANFFDTVRPNEEGTRIAGKYGMSGLGKTILGKALCNLNVENYGGRVFHIEFGESSALGAQKLALRYLTRSRESQFEWVTGEDDVRYVFCSLVEGQKVYLVLDNITEYSIDNVREYLGAELGEGSCILLIARSVDILLQNSLIVNPESCMRMPRLEDKEAVAILLEEKLNTQDRRLALQCAKTCLIEKGGDFTCLIEEGGDFPPTFHPLALKVLGRHCFSKHHLNLSKWVAEIGGLSQRASRGDHGYLRRMDFNALFYMAFADMDAESRSIFMLLNQFKPPNLSSHEIIKGLAENFKEEVKNLYNKGFIEETEPEIRIHHLMEEFAKSLLGRQLQDHRTLSLQEGYPQLFSRYPQRLSTYPQRWSTYRVPPMQGEARMCQELEDFFKGVQPNEKGIRIAGLYGIPGQGKTRLAKAFCSFNIRKYDWPVCHLEFCGDNKLERLKFALVDLTNYPWSAMGSLKSEVEARVQFNKGVKGKGVIFLLDNIETDESIEEVGEYLRADFRKYSRILLIARSVEVLLNNNFNINSQSCMQVPSVTEEEAVAILLERASLLKENPALSLFCQHAFGIPTSPSDPHLDDELQEKVLAECRGYPLPVKEIVSSNYHKDGLFHRLQTSIGALDDNEKQCFLDLAAFPRRKSIRANALLDIWVYVRGMTWDRAVVLLLKFAARQLLQWRGHDSLPYIADDGLNSYTLSQDDVHRNLALLLVELYNTIHFRRMYVFQEKSNSNPERQTDRYQSSEAQIVSFHTGEMTDTQWPQMDFPEAEALVLCFNAPHYCIPRFLLEMGKLKVLIIHNAVGIHGDVITGLDNFQLPSQLQSLHLEMLKVPSLLEHCQGLERLEKIRFSQCRGLGRDTKFDFPGLLECYVDPLGFITELPAGICSSKSLKVLSITNCRALTKLPEELDKLRSLKEIRLSGGFNSIALPPSICKLTKLEILDFSGASVCRQDEHIFKETLQKLAKIQSLMCVICDARKKELFESTFRHGLLILSNPWSIII